MPATLVHITGSIYNPFTGAKITSGRFHLTPKNFVVNGSNLIAPFEVTYDIPGTGNIDLQIAPTASATVYVVEFDPNVADTSTPLQMKNGYYRDEWNVPAINVDIAAL